MSKELTFNHENAYKIMQDKASSFWLKAACQRLMERDIVDGKNDIDALQSLFN